MEINIRDIQLKELEILKEFIIVCNKLNVKYFLDSGTLLGCIRHEGFIPWDDDIDVSMPREDYELFLKKGQELLPKRFFLQTYETDPEYTMNFAKIRNSETTFIETTVKNLKINHGLYIDIFPIDGYKPNKKIKNFINKKIYTLCNLQINKKYILPKKDENLKEKIQMLVSNILYGKKTIKQIIIKKDRIAKKYEYKNCDYVGMYCYPTVPISKNYLEKEVFDTEYRKFEDIPNASVPKKYDEYLKNIYGNYMKLPPKEKRVAHHYNEIIDLEKSYKLYERKEK